MVALCNRADHYIFILFLLSSSSFFCFPRLISAVGDWMSTILWHMLMPNVMITLPNIGGTLCSTPQSLADAHCWSTVQ